MNRIITTLSVILGVQLLIAAVVLWPRQQAAEGLAQAALLTLPADSVTRIAVSDADNVVLLERRNDRWSLPEYHRLPADAGKIDALLQQLPALSRGWPVATTATARERFEVDEDSFQRRITWYQDESELGTLFLGTSPGFRQVHARPDDSSDVYAVEFNTFDAPADAAAWMDKALLQVDEVQQVRGLDYQIQQSESGWQNEAGAAADAEAAQGLVSGLQSLRVSGVADLATAGILDDTEVPPTLQVSSGDRELEYRLYEIEDAYYVRRADIPIYFTLSAFDHDRLNDVNADALFPPPVEDDELAEEDSPDDGEPKAALAEPAAEEG